MNSLENLKTDRIQVLEVILLQVDSVIGQNSEHCTNFVGSKILLLLEDIETEHTIWFPSVTPSQEQL